MHLRETFKNIYYKYPFLINEYEVDKISWSEGFDLYD